MEATQGELQDFDVCQKDLDICMQVLEKLEAKKSKIASVTHLSKVWKRLCHKIDVVAEHRGTASKQQKLQLRRNRKQRRQKMFQETLLILKTNQHADDAIGTNRTTCYICKKNVEQNHCFYKAMCEECGTFNFGKHNQTCNLQNKVAIVTGGRIKIGFEVALKLLRAECTVVITTRFSVDATQRYFQQLDYNTWKHRLHIVRANFLSRRDVDDLCDYILEHFPKIDILINNSAQTICKPDVFYQELYLKEQQQQPQILQDHQEDSTDYKTTQWFPKGQYDIHGEQVDLRSENSWVSTITTTPIDELLQAQIINCSVPFLLIQKLTPVMKECKAPLGKNQQFSFIINVSAMESYLRDYFISMNSVDTGYITNEFPHNHPQAKAISPLDEIDGAARILDPIFTACNDNFIVNGTFLKDYHVSKW